MVLLLFHISVNWDVFCNFSKNGRSNGADTCCTKFVMNSSYIGRQLLTTLLLIQQKIIRVYQTLKLIISAESAQGGHN